MLFVRGGVSVGLSGTMEVGKGRAPSLSRSSIWWVVRFALRDNISAVMPEMTSFPYVIREKEGRRLVEFPITTTEFFGRNLPLGGGGYLRLLPYVYMKWGMRRVNRQEGQGTVFYVHPWEVDPDQPRMKTAGRRGFSSHYVNLASTEAKLRRLLRDFRFAPMRDCLSLA